MLLFKWQMIFILILLLAKLTFSTDQSKTMPFTDILAKQRLLSRAAIIDQNKVFVFGHRNPDTDTITSALIYASFLRSTHINAKAYRLGDLNNETKFVLKTAGIEEPDMLPDHLANGTQVALVDHNESELNQF
jgi:nanoRNase/pAp phosphatase (c-di-AMP/oligoRNAs hydrolase)